MDNHSQWQFSRIRIQDLNEAWQLIEALRAEAAEISFTDYQHIDEIQHWPHSDEHLVYIARSSEGQLAGIVRGKRENSLQKRHAVFLTAATASFARGLGLANRLTTYALEQMRLEGVTLARIYVYSDNTASLKAVAKLGFEKAGVVKAHHFDLNTQTYIDDIIFHKILD